MTAAADAHVGEVDRMLAICDQALKSESYRPFRRQALVGEVGYSRKSGRVCCDGMSGDSRGKSTFVYPVYACVSGV